ncbi:GlxA family transcriptional regulator [Cellulosimicrobium sp. CpK407]|uniref:GlxA family transcriptional regulator n=1 Tax=Cellulosimicrobium sp. CpK407 TaxID=3229847 RepID=UPI003F3938A6
MTLPTAADVAESDRVPARERARESARHPERVAVVAFDGISPFHLAVPSLVLGSDALAGGARPAYDVVVCAPTPGRLATSAGFALHVDHGLEAIEGATTVVLPSWHPDVEPPPALLAAVRAAHARGARVVGLCLGAFLVAASGVADGREVVTHWHAAERLGRDHPAVTVRSDVLWVDHGDVVTSAGTAAALDCCLHLVRQDHGARVAARVARALVLAPHRTGGQAQFVPAPVPPQDTADPVELAMVWARAHLDEPISLDAWACAAGTSRRTFTRRFAARTGLSPVRWLLDQRVDRARELLETTDLAVDRVADAAGLGSAESLRHHFRARLGTSPSRYRVEFGGAPVARPDDREPARPLAGRRR